MTLTDFATFSTAVSGLAVTASLIYLALQTHQNSKHTRALIHQGRVAALREVFLASADADISRAYLVSTGHEATAQGIQHQQYQFVLGAMIYGWQDTFSQARLGLLDDGFLLQMRHGAERIMLQPVAREAWAQYRVPGTDFTAFMDGIAAAAAIKAAPPFPSAGYPSPGAET
jgi:hypothetical protein